MADRLKPVEEHLADVLGLVRPLEPFGQMLMDAHGCVLAEDVIAPWPLPMFDNSAMDGYAVRAGDTADATEGRPVRLRVIADVPAGSTYDGEVVAGTAVRLMTGSPMPVGADSVVPVEHTDGGTDEVLVTAPTTRGRHLRHKGEDIEAGVVALSAGTKLAARHVALAASVGRHQLLVRPRARVVIVSTGSELVSPGTEPKPGQVVDSNSFMVALAAREVGAVPFRTGIVADDARTLMHTLDEQQIRADMVITTGGVSAGAYDVVKQALIRTGTVSFARLAMQPGMPQGYGTLGPDRLPLFTLPGNPVSAYVSFQVFVRPALRLMMGREPVIPPVRIPTAVALTSPAGKQQYLRAAASAASGTWQVTPVGGPGSHLLGGLAAANALIVVPPELTEVPAGTEVDVLMLDAQT